MTIQTMGSIRFTTHTVVVSKDMESDRIYCFKHTDNRCDFESFDQVDSAADYIIAPFERIEYYVHIE